jgi:hypothetical protein
LLKINIVEIENEKSIKFNLKPEIKDIVEK